MNDRIRDNSGREGRAVRRRHVVYVEAWDPRGAQGYFDMFRRTCDRSQRLWPVSVTLQPLEIDSADFAHWRLDLRGSDWQTTTHYDFLRMERFIRADMARPTAWQMLGATCWRGAQMRIFRASWRFGLHLLFFQMLLVVWLAVAGIIGLTVSHTLMRYGGWSVAPSILVSLVAAAVAVVALRPLAERGRLIQLFSSWVVMRRFARGRPTWLDHAVDVAARRIVAAARANEVDELAVIGHSSGGAIASAIMARALELDPDLGRGGPRLVLLTLGTLLPALALNPAAQKIRDVVRRLATAPTLVWIDCQSRKDVMCFANFDPVEGVGIDVGTQRCNPLLWRLSFKEMIAPERYRRFRWNFFRVHFQYIMAGDQPAPYDYLLLVGGPTAMAQWPNRARDLVAAFSQDARPGNEPRSDVAIGSSR